jgi:hypothetical protein
MPCALELAKGVLASRGAELINGIQNPRQDLLSLGGFIGSEMRSHVIFLTAYVFTAMNDHPYSFPIFCLLALSQVVYCRYI